jgi:hypothetical protein
MSAFHFSLYMATVNLWFYYICRSIGVERKKKAFLLGKEKAIRFILFYASEGGMRYLTRGDRQRFEIEKMNLQLAVEPDLNICCIGIGFSSESPVAAGLSVFISM